MISTEKSFDLLPSVVEIYEKLDLKNYIIAKQEENKGKEVTDQLNILTTLDLFAYVLKNSKRVKEEFFEIVSIVEEKKIKEVKAQPLAKTLKTIKELFSDKDLMDFFSEAVQ